jgi:hypothetical protein
MLFNFLKNFVHAKVPCDKHKWKFKSRTQLRCKVCGEIMQLKTETITGRHIEWHGVDKRHDRE